MKSILFACLVVATFGAANAQGQRPPPSTRDPLGPPSTRRTTELTAAALDNFALWTTYTSAGGGYSVKFPGKPGTDQVPVAASAPNFLRNLAIWDFGAGRILEVDYYDFKGKLYSAEGAETGGLSALIDVVVGKGGEVLSRGDIVKGACHGKEVTLWDKNGAAGQVPSVIKMRAFASGDKVFVVYASGGKTPKDLGITDFFLDSFSVTGGCVETVTPKIVTSTTSSAVEGSLDNASGWRRIDSPYGINFLLPQTAKLDVTKQETAMGSIMHYTYSNDLADQVFTVEVFDGYNPEFFAKDTLKVGTFAAVTAELRKNLGKGGLILGECKPVSLGALAGNECQISGSKSIVYGRAQIFTASARLFVLIALRKVADTDESAGNRFFASVKIEHK